MLPQFPFLPPAFLRPRVRYLLLSFFILLLYLLHISLPLPYLSTLFFSHQFQPQLLSPFALPRTLLYNSSNPFSTSFVPPPPHPDRSDDLGGAEEYRKVWQEKREMNPRLMEKLMMRQRGGEEAVRRAWDEARTQRGKGQEPVGEDDDDDDGKEDFEWLRGKTILLMGDSLDRYHTLHLCQYLTPLSPLHPTRWPSTIPSEHIAILSPSHTPLIYPKPLIDLEASMTPPLRGKEGWARDPSRSWMCRIDPDLGDGKGGLDVVVVWGYLWGWDDGAETLGLEVYGGGEKGQEGGQGLVGEKGTYGEQAKEMPFGDRAYWPFSSEHFHPPLSASSRLTELYLPLLTALNRPVSSIALVEVGLMAWDLDMFRTQDRLSVERYLASPAGQSESRSKEELAAELSRKELSKGRIEWWEKGLSGFLEVMEDTFPEGPMIRLRPQPLPPQHYSWPWLTASSRIHQLYNSTHRVVEKARRSRGSRVDVADWAEGLESSRRMVGEEDEGGEGGMIWLDHVHPGAPASWAWAEEMLWSLKKGSRLNG